MQSLTATLSGGALAGPIKACMNAGVASYVKLAPEHRQHIDELVKATIEFVESAKKQYPKVKEYASNINLDNISSLLKLVTKMLRKKSTAGLVQHYLDVCADMMDNPKRMKAIGAYMVCLLSHLDEKHKEVVVLALELAYAFIQVIAQTDVKSKVVAMSGSVHKHVMRPMYKEIARKK